MFIPEHLKIMIEQEVKEKNYDNINNWLKTKYTGDWSIQAIKQVISGKTKSPAVHLLEDVRRVCTKTGVASKHNFAQLPLIRTAEIRRIVGEDAGLSYKYIADYLGIDQPTLGNTVNDKVQYRYLTAWSLTHFFVKYFENPWHMRNVVTWDFYGWVKERREQEGVMTAQAQAKFRDAYNRRMNGPNKKAE